MKLKNITVQVGGFHDHWLRNGTDNPSVLIAAVTKYHYDFICLMDSEFLERASQIKQQIEKWIPGFKVHLGTERIYGWGHLVTVMNDNAKVNLQNTDFKDELANAKKADGIVALAHISYPSSKEKIINTKKLDELIDEDLVDAIQIQTESDWQYIKKRALSDKKLPLISGWDSHMLFDMPDMPDCLYNKNFGVAEHFDHSSLMRTIVFADDNSLASIKKALKKGLSVLEDTGSGKFFGSPQLIEMLLSNGYKEKMAVLDSEYNSLNIDCGSFTANLPKAVQFPSEGTVIYPYSSELIPQRVETNENGVAVIPGTVMPTSQDTSYIPLFWQNGEKSRYWAVKIENDIQLDAVPKIKNGKRILTIFSKKAFSGKLIFEKPYFSEHIVKCDSNSLLFELPIDDTMPLIFYYSFTAIADSGSKRQYSSKVAVAAAHKFNGSWETADKIYLDGPEYCGGFGSCRPYPGKDIFSSEIQFMWDKDYLYVKYDIVDKIYIAPSEELHMMYLSDTTTLNVDPFLARSKSRNSGCEMILGFPKHKGVIFCTHASVDKDGKPYSDCKDNTPINGKLTMEQTKNGRIVTAKIPWKEISPMIPDTGTHIGITVGCLNNEGAGLVDNMQWPWPPTSGSWLFPCSWGILALID